MTRRETARTFLKLVIMPGLYLGGLAVAGCNAEHPELNDPAAIEALKARAKRTKAADPYDPETAKSRRRTKKGPR